MAASGFFNTSSFIIIDEHKGLFNNEYWIFALPGSHDGYLQIPSSGMTLDSHVWESGIGAVGGIMYVRGAESGTTKAGGYVHADPGYEVLDGKIGGWSHGVHVKTSGIIGGYEFGVHGADSAAFGGTIQGIKGRHSGIIGGRIITEPRGSGSAIVGGVMYVLATPFDNKFMGGYVFGDAPFDYKIMGGYIQTAQIIDQSGGFGGVAYGLRGHNEAGCGGFTIGTWNRPGESIVTNLSRILVKGNDDIVVGQSFSTNAKYVLYKSINDNFDAEVRILKSDTPEFDAEVAIVKYHYNPKITITDVVTVGAYPWVVTVTASGHSYDSNNEIIVSGINEMDFIWSDGDVDELKGSGMIYSATHTFSNSGIYKPIVMGYDKNRRAGSDFTTLNFAPGLDVPHISLSGIPRSGVNPLVVDFTAATSGVLGAYNIFWDFSNGLYFYENTNALTMQYPMPGDYIPYVRIVDSRGIATVDTLKIGYNR